MKLEANRPRCWQCHGKLEVQRGALIFDTVDIHGTLVKVHKVCRKDAEAEQQYERLTVRIEEETNHES